MCLAAKTQTAMDFFNRADPQDYLLEQQLQSDIQLPHNNTILRLLEQKVLTKNTPV